MDKSAERMQEVRGQKTSPKRGFLLVDSQPDKLTPEQDGYRKSTYP
jgi:hypothetical protein